MKHLIGSLIIVFISFVANADSWMLKPTDSRNGFRYVDEGYRTLLKVENKKGKGHVISPQDFSDLDLERSFIFEVEARSYVVAIWKVGQRAQVLSVYDSSQLKARAIYQIKSYSLISAEKTDEGVEILYSPYLEGGEKLAKAFWKPPK